MSLNEIINHVESVSNSVGNNSVGNNPFGDEYTNIINYIINDMIDHIMYLTKDHITNPFLSEEFKIKYKNYRMNYYKFMGAQQNHLELLSVGDMEDRVLNSSEFLKKKGAIQLIKFCKCVEILAKAWHNNFISCGGLYVTSNYGMHYCALKTGVVPGEYKLTNKI